MKDYISRFERTTLPKKSYCLLDLAFLVALLSVFIYCMIIISDVR